MKSLLQMGMTPEEYRQAADIFERVVPLAEPARSAALANECGENAALLQSVRNLLAADEGVKANFLDSNALSDVARALTRNLAEDIPDRYRPLREIGSGGMGTVWLAEQTEPIRRQVAIKLIGRGMHTADVIARFGSERQALALMNHPAIAKVFDAASTPEGLPYFVMEFVDGVPLTVFCDRHTLPLRRRLALFQEVCEGVQHAHQKAIVHRDLKPSNILVAEVEGRPVPKIIDFGMAKAIQPGIFAEMTATGVILGTPNYMSPEQALMVNDVDTRSDVYSLGVILYELLAGVVPLDFAHKLPAEFFQALREEDSVKPSLRVRQLPPDTLAACAVARAATPAELIRLLSGDLDCILQKALDKDRARRYGSAAELAADIQRHLNNEPVAAAPPTTAYFAWKFVRRYRLPLATLSVFILVLLAATVISIRERLRANAEAATAQAVSDFLRHDLLAQASTTTQVAQHTKPALDLTVRTVLDRAAKRLSGRFAEQPEVEDALRQTIGQAYSDLGLDTDAYPQFARALELHRRSLGFNDRASVLALSNVAQTLLLEGKYDEATPIRLEALAAARRVLGSDDPVTLRVLNGLAANYGMQGRLDLAEPLFQEAYRRQLRVLGAENPDTLLTLNNLATLVLYRCNYAEAEPLFKKLLDIRLRVLGADDPQTLVTQSHRAEALLGEGRYAEAEAAERLVLAGRKRVLGPENSFTLLSMSNLGVDYLAEGRFAEAEAILTQALDIQRRAIGEEHLETLDAMRHLAEVYNCQGAYGRAAVLLRQVIDSSKRLRGAEDLLTLIALTEYAVSLTGQHRYAEARALLTSTLEVERRVLGPESDQTLKTLAALLRLDQWQRNFASAAPNAALLLAGRRKTFGPNHPDTVIAMLALARNEYWLGKFDSSQALAREALTVCQKSEPNSWRRFAAEALLAAINNPRGTRLNDAPSSGRPAFEPVLASPHSY